MPIVFAFIVGRAIKTVAHWRLQQGERIGRLDLLYGSTTVVGTISTMIDMGEFGLVALMLVIVWVFSPLGAQSALRVLSIRPGYDTTFNSVPYFNTSTHFPGALMTGDIGGYVSPPISLFLSSLGAPNSTKQSSLDTWGNVKIPILEMIPAYKGNKSADWISLGKNDSRPDLTYSSLIGIPIAAIPQNQNSTFTIETSYLNLHCDDLEQVKTGDMIEKGKEMEKASPANCEGGDWQWNCCMNMTWGKLSTVPYPQGRTNSTPLRCEESNPKYARQMAYLNWDNEGGSYTKCSMSTTYVELSVECVGWNCISTHIRPSRLKSNPGPNHTIFDGSCNDQTQYTFSWFANVLNKLTQIQTGTGSPTVSLLQTYLVDPDHALNTTALYSQPAVNTLSKSVFSLRLGQIINTFWLASAATEPVFLGHPPDYDSLSLRTTGGESIIKVSNTNATFTTSVTRVRCDFGWLVPLALSTVIMLAAAVLTMAVDMEIQVPKMLMNMTTLTRADPKTFSLPPGGGGLRDEVRGKLIRDLRVRFGIMKGNDINDYMTGICLEDGGNVYMAGQRPMILQTDEEVVPNSTRSSRSPSPGN
ncbi:hypothetical protein BGZ63DRAFT_19253 [Mariannaea sp. PMI_226]|nr:hypothetical protein BGZ63DRAFT_19253 [Mariannaea sp. PMI_226]